ncbi:hypothetical protein K402DRAFT_415890 [Aulographum hederae CBS 113979]|uniref:Uncharacterized protein n=1 Tax=Aulographum hederae CBS 113979 TaxID=1176131 RepID=A0A6G1HGN3_9PEZI|nr:hypothetical protein K402DRAFT_415890 [Aulographum hederae CBS 113979]
MAPENWNSSSCYFPGGNQPAGGNPMVPCNPNAAVSACCQVGESCTSSGLCFSGNGMIYRGGCTDKTFKDATCSKVCLDSGTLENDVQFLRQCQSGPIDKPLWDCGAQCTNITSFSLRVGGVLYSNITGLVDSSNTTITPIDVVNATPAPSPSPSQKASCNVVKGTSAVTVGAAVGATFGVLLLCAVAWALWERRRRLKEASQPMEIVPARYVQPTGGFSP